MKASDPEDAISEFLGIPALESEKGEWGFKGLKQAIKLEYKLKKYDEVSHIVRASYKRKVHRLTYREGDGSSANAPLCGHTVNQQAYVSGLTGSRR